MRAQEPIMATGLGGRTNEESRDLIVVPALLLCGAPRSRDESCVVSQSVRRYTQDESCVFVVYHSREPI
jgi:hypothetical protein